MPDGVLDEVVHHAAQQTTIALDDGRLQNHLGAEAGCVGGGGTLLEGLTYERGEIDRFGLGQRVTACQHQ